MESIDFTPKNYFVSIICFKIKNPPTLYLENTTDNVANQGG
jgi:hypothetical protein